MTQRSKYRGSLNNEYRPFLSLTNKRAASFVPGFENISPFSSVRSLVVLLAEGYEKI